MLKPLLKVFSVSLFVLLLSCSGHPSVFSIDLKKTSGDFFSISEVRNNKATLFVFLSTECPLSQKYTLPLKQLEKKYAGDEVKFIGVFPGANVSDTSIKSFSEEYDLDFALLRDENLELTHFLNATITPEVFVLDNKGNVIYSGAIDNWFAEVGKKREVVTEHYLDDALGSLITEKEIKVKKTIAVGCIIE